MKQTEAHFRTFKPFVAHVNIVYAINNCLIDIRKGKVQFFAVQLSESKNYFKFLCEAKIKFSNAMEVMEEGNLMDRVPVLLQRDMQYYQVYDFIYSFT